MHDISIKLLRSIQNSGNDSPSWEPVYRNVGSYIRIRHEGPNAIKSSVSGYIVTPVHRNAMEGG